MDSNDWSAFHPHSAVVLLESWTPILPPFIRDNILDQLILPKIKKAVEEWSHKPSRSGKVRSLAGVIFPWLPLLGPRMEEVMELAKRRIRSVLRAWTVQEGVPAELAKWRKDVSTPTNYKGAIADMSRCTPRVNGINSCFNSSFLNSVIPFERTLGSIHPIRKCNHWRNGFCLGIPYFDRQCLFISWMWNYGLLGLRFCISGWLVQDVSRMKLLAGTSFAILNG